MTKPELSTAGMAIAGALMLALGFALVLQGALPFLAAPTRAQALWTAGFAQSFVNDSLLSIFAENFGGPQPAPIAFGLAGAYPAGLLIASGLHPVDAYAATAALWLSVSLLSAWCLGLQLGVRPWLSVAAALLWISMPVIWAHAGYSMLSIGIALLPLYFLATYRVIGLNSGEALGGRIGTACLFLAICIIAVFMDGYSFMMFVVGSIILAAYVFVRMPQSRRHLLTFGFPLFAAGWILAYLLYAAYLGRLEFSPNSLKFLRGWGADVLFFVVPTKGIYWFWDAVGWSVARSDRDFFGDASVWTTTFCLPLVLAGAIAWFLTRSRNALATGFLLVALFGLYMSLGPSLKIASVRPEAMAQANSLPRSMPEKFAVAPTGSGWLSAYAPGFKNMRAAYRWIALAVFGFWALLLLLLAQIDSPRARAWSLAGMALLILFNLPQPARIASYAANRSMFFAIDRDLVDDMRGALRGGEEVAFLPYRNDFLVNYLAARLKLRTYNIGGDKNLEAARASWPPTMAEFQRGKIDPGFANRVVSLLTRQEADAVVLPYIDMLRAAHSWPAPLTFEQEMEPVLLELAASNLVTVERRKYYSVVRLAKTPPVPPD